MSKSKKRSELATTQAVGARTVIMDRPPEMTMVPDGQSLRTIPPPRAARHAASATPSIMTTTVLLTTRAPRPASPPPPPPPPTSLRLTSVLATSQAMPGKPVQPPPIPRASAGQQPAPLPKPTPARTRMVDLHDALANQSLPPLPLAFSPHPPPHAPTGHAPPVALLSMPGSANRWMRVIKERRSLLVAAAGALLLLLLLLLPQLTGESEAEALEEHAPATASHASAIVPTPEKPAVTPEPAPAATPASPQTAAPNPAPDAMQATTPNPVSGTEAQGPVSEAQAGALLLSGRRTEALSSYRALAQKPGAHPGIEAMVIVLEQKVNSL